jgi:hypothetical protein
MLIRYPAMANALFNVDDPWHSWANFLFDFSCDRCSAQIDFKWPDEQRREAWFEACVETAEEAQRQGWTCVDEFTFRCGACSK